MINITQLNDNNTINNVIRREYHLQANYFDIIETKKEINSIVEHIYHKIN